MSRPDPRLFKLIALLGLVGCASESRLRLTSYKDPYFPETYTAEFREAGFRTLPTGDVLLSAYAGTAAADSGAVRQWLCVHAFWRPQPGKTFAHPTSTNATIRYVVASEAGVASYEGTGFIYPVPRSADADWRATLETAALQLVETRGDPPDLFGDARLIGKIHATPNATRAVDLEREMLAVGAARRGG